MSDSPHFIGSFVLDEHAKIGVAIAKLTDNELEIKNQTEYECPFGPYAFVKKTISKDIVILYLFKRISQDESLALRIFKIHSNFISSDLSNVSPTELFFDFMDSFGLPVPEIGNKKYLIDEEKHYFVMGDLDVDRYQNALKKEGLV